MNQPQPLRFWPARYRSSMLEIHESEHHEIWVASIEVRKVLPSLRADSQLQKEYGSGFKKLDKGPRIFLSEEALGKELQRMRSRDALMFLAWLHKTVVYPATRKREGLPALTPMPATAKQEQQDDADVENGAEEQALGFRSPVFQPLHTARTRRIKPLHSTAESEGFMRRTVIEPVLRIWRGEEELARTIVVGGLAMLGWTLMVWGWIALIADPNHYTGTYLLRQWIVVGLILGSGSGLVWWCVGVMRCATRRHREGRSFGVSLLAFTGSLSIMLNLSLLPLTLAGEWMIGWWDTVTLQIPMTRVSHDPQLGRIVVRGEIGFGSYKELEQAIQMKPRLTLVQIESPGGFVVEGLAMAQLIEKHGLDTVSLEECASACTYLLAAGHERYLGPNAVVGFHRSWAFRVKSSSKWSALDYEVADYYRSRNTADDFVRHALDTPGHSMWFPTHGEMVTAGYATRPWSERKSGY